jgi:CheY-like chemotaxis protein
VGRVLVVDDDAMFQEFIREELGRLGHEAAAAANGREAIVAVRKDPPDLILLDLRMPLMDGIDALRALREARCGAPVILLTARRNPEVLAQARALGAAEVLFKPVDLIQLFLLLGERLGPR